MWRSAHDTDVLQFDTVWEVDNNVLLQGSVLRGIPLFLRIWVALASSGHNLTLTGASDSVQTFAIVVVGALALSISTVPMSRADVAPTLEVPATLRRTQTATMRARMCSVVSKKVRLLIRWFSRVRGLQAPILRCKT